MRVYALLQNFFLRPPTKRSGRHNNRGHENLRKLVKADKALADVAGQEFATRSEFVRLVWKYIKDNRLQDPMDGRFIYIDYKLSRVMGPVGQRYYAFKMLRHIEAHLIKNHEGSGSQAGAH